jgi:hypothetical protein
VTRGYPSSIHLDVQRCGFLKLEDGVGYSRPMDRIRTVLEITPYFRTRFKLCVRSNPVIPDSSGQSSITSQERHLPAPVIRACNDEFSVGNILPQQISDLPLYLCDWSSNARPLSWLDFIFHVEK